MSHWNAGWDLVVLALMGISMVVAYLVGLSTGEMRGKRQQVSLAVGRVYRFGEEKAEFVLVDYTVDYPTGTLQLGFELHDAWRERMKIA